jgi:cytochrome o ubiquinol oxidase subunit 1
MFGKLTLDAFKHNLIEMAANLSICVVLFILIGLLTYFHRWKWLWKEWLTSLDPKKIGVMYLIVAIMMLFKGLMDAFMMRAQQATSVGELHGYLSSSHFQQLFTAHGTTMIFFVGMGVVFGLLNLVVPLQIGARDVAFPFLNSLSFWLFAVGAGLLILSLIIGEFSGAGWVAYPPLSGLAYSPSVGVDYWIWSVQIAGVGSLLSGINFLVTIIKLRCPGMTLMRMPIFVWSALGAVILIIFAFPILTATAGMLALDRLMGMHFFTPDFGGNQMMYVNLIWAWGHPEVYILILPAFGIYSEVVATLSQKSLFGYGSMVWALAGITFLSFIVWLHHFFTMGAGADVNAFFGVMTMLIAVPTGVKVFNWLFTMYRGRIHLTSPMLWFLGFVVIFTIGGMAGVLLSVAPIDFQMHNSLFLIAHFHSMVIGGLLFGFFAGFGYWFPKFMGFELNEKLGKCAFGCWFTGFLFAFMPLYLLGFMGATRRLDHYEAATGWQPLFVVAGIGAGLVFLGMTLQIAQLILSIKKRKEAASDPWNGRTLEWATASPPPLYNFAVLPEATGRDVFWFEKQSPTKSKPVYEDLYIPKNSPAGFVIGGLSFLVGFGLIWHIFWLAGLSLLGIIACLIIRLSNDEVEYVLTASEVKNIEAEQEMRKHLV